MPPAGLPCAATSGSDATAWAWGRARGVRGRRAGRGPVCVRAPWDAGGAGGSAPVARWRRPCQAPGPCVRSGRRRRGPGGRRGSGASPALSPSSRSRLRLSHLARYGSARGPGRGGAQQRPGLPDQALDSRERPGHGRAYLLEPGEGPRAPARGGEAAARGPRTGRPGPRLAGPVWGWGAGGSAGRSVAGPLEVAPVHAALPRWVGRASASVGLRLLPVGRLRDASVLRTAPGFASGRWAPVAPEFQWCGGQLFRVNQVSALELEGVSLVRKERERKQKAQRHKVQAGLEPGSRSQSCFPKSDSCFLLCARLYSRPVSRCLAAGR